MVNRLKLNAIACPFGSMKDQSVNLPAEKLGFARYLHYFPYGRKLWSGTCADLQCYLADRDRPAAKRHGRRLKGVETMVKPRMRES